MDAARLITAHSSVAPANAFAPAHDAGLADSALKTAREFESLFLAQFAQIMFSGVKSDGPFGGGPAEEIFKNLLAEEYGKTLARSGGVGIADSVHREILKLQEIA